jgi:hypothetical protein
MPHRITQWHSSELLASHLTFVGVIPTGHMKKIVSRAQSILGIGKTTREVHNLESLRFNLPLASPSTLS